MQSAAGFNTIPESVWGAGTQWRSRACPIPSMDFETVSDILGFDCRRAVVEVLRNEGLIARHRLIDRLAGRNVDVREYSPTTTSDSMTTSDPARRYRIHVALHHDHLPRLADAGLVEYDDETVTATPELDRFVEWLDPLDSDGEVSDDSESTDDFRANLMAFYA